MTDKNRRTPLSQGILSFTSNEQNISVNRSIQSPVSFNDEGHSPRQVTPTKIKAVPKPKYADELFTSDVENDCRKTPTNLSDSLPKRRHMPPEVLHTEIDEDYDAIRSGEVSVKTYKIQSPARVICHSPSSLNEENSNQRQNEKHELKAKRKESGKPKSLSFNTTSDSMLANHKNVVPVRNSSAKSAKMKSKSAEKGSASGTKKKKKNFPVESRFKQDAATKKPDETLRSKSLELSAITPHSGLQSSSNVQAQQKKSRVTSTPFLMTSMYEAQTGNDGTILDQTRFQQQQQHANEPVIRKAITKNPTTKKKKESTWRKERESTKRNNSSKENSKEIRGSGNENDQLLVDLYNARRLQQTYLYMKARQTFDKQEEKAKDELYALWAINRKTEKEIEALTLTLHTRRMEIAIDQLLNVQIEGFKPLPAKLSKVIIKSNHFTDALTNISHYLELKGVMFDKQDTLMAALNESKQLLGQIIALTRHQQPGIEELSTSNEVLVKTVKEELQQQSRCSELLGACSSLMNKELSLQAQVIQS